MGFACVFCVEQFLSGALASSGSHKKVKECCENATRCEHEVLSFFFHVQDIHLDLIMRSGMQNI